MFRKKSYVLGKEIYKKIQKSTNHSLCKLILNNHVRFCNVFLLLFQIKITNMASNQNNQIMPVAEQKSQQQRPQQPRPRRDLQGLLKFCMEATKSEDAPANSDPSPPENPEELMAAMPEENREWLRAVRQK